MPALASRPQGPLLEPLAPDTPAAAPASACALSPVQLWPPELSALRPSVTTAAVEKLAPEPGPELGPAPLERGI